MSRASLCGFRPCFPRRLKSHLPGGASWTGLQKSRPYSTLRWGFGHGCCGRRGWLRGAIGASVSFSTSAYLEPHLGKQSNHVVTVAVSPACLRCANARCSSAALLHTAAFFALWYIGLEVALRGFGIYHCSRFSLWRRPGVSVEWNWYFRHEQTDKLAQQSHGIVCLVETHHHIIRMHVWFDAQLQLVTYYFYRTRFEKERGRHAHFASTLRVISRINERQVRVKYGWGDDRWQQWLKNMVEEHFVFEKIV